VGALFLGAAEKQGGHIGPPLQFSLLSLRERRVGEVRRAQAARPTELSAAAAVLPPRLAEV